MKNLNEQIAFYATQYEQYYDIDYAIKKSIQDLIQDDELNNLDTAQLIDEYNNYLIESNRVDDYIYENDEYFFNENFENSMESVRATFYGDYRYMDDYVQFNVYGNLNSYQEYEVRELIKENQDFLDYIYEYQFDPADYDIDLDEIKEILEKLLEAGY